MVKLDTKTATTFKIYDTYTKNITLYIEGISESGQLISERKTIREKETTQLIFKFTVST